MMEIVARVDVARVGAATATIPPGFAALNPGYATLATGGVDAI